MRKIYLLCCLFLWSCQSSPTGIEEGEWHLVREPAEDFPYSAIHFADQQHGWAVGHAGIIIHSADGGNTWEYQPSGTKSSLRDVYFLNSSTGWAAGSNDTIIHTTDGGKTWASQPIIRKTARTYYDIYFADELTGWIVSDYGEILHTSDGGSTWEEQRRSKFIGDPKCLSFINKDVGFALLPGTDLFKTIDGGATWDSVLLQLTCPGRQHNPFEPTDLLFLDEQHGWIATLSYSSITIDSAALFYTTNGGNTWSCQNALFIQQFQSIHFVDNLTGWTIGSQRVIHPYPHMIFQTTDGGRTWNMQFEKEGMPFRDIYFTDAEHGWALDYLGAVYKYTVP